MMILKAVYEDPRSFVKIVAGRLGYLPVVESISVCMAF